MTDLACREQHPQAMFKQNPSGRVAGHNIRVVRGSGRVLTGDLHDEAQTSNSSGSRFSDGLVIDGEKECGLKD